MSVTLDDGTVLRPHLWSLSPISGETYCCLCGETKERLRSPDHPAPQWWCWDATYDLEAGLA